MIAAYAMLWQVVGPLKDTPKRSYRKVVSPGFGMGWTYGAGRRQVVALLNGKVIGSTRKGSLRLKADSTGLRFNLDAPMPRGLVGVSFRVRHATWSFDGAGFRWLVAGELAAIVLEVEPAVASWPQTLQTVREMKA